MSETVLIYHGEWYPVYSTYDWEGYRDGENIDVPALTAARWRQITEDFVNMQSEMKKALISDQVASRNPVKNAQ